MIFGALVDVSGPRWKSLESPIICRGIFGSLLLRLSHSHVAVWRWWIIFFSISKAFKSLILVFSKSSGENIGSLARRRGGLPVGWNKAVVDLEFYSHFHISWNTRGATCRCSQFIWRCHRTFDTDWSLRPWKYEVTPNYVLVACVWRILKLYIFPFSFDPGAQLPWHRWRRAALSLTPRADCQERISWWVLETENKHGNSHVSAAMLVYGGYSILLEPFSQSNTSVAIDPPDDSSTTPHPQRRSAPAGHQIGIRLLLGWLGKQRVESLNNYLDISWLQ